MKEYAHSNHTYNKYALEHIKANNIYCHHYEWCHLIGQVDGCKIDGKMRYFNMYTHKEVDKDAWK